MNSHLMSDIRFYIVPILKIMIRDTDAGFNWAR